MTDSNENIKIKTRSHLESLQRIPDLTKERVLISVDVKAYKAIFGEDGLETNLEVEDSIYIVGSHDVDNLKLTFDDADLGASFVVDLEKATTEKRLLRTDRGCPLGSPEACEKDE